MNRAEILQDFIAEGGAARIILSRFGATPDFFLETAETLTVEHADKPEYLGAAVTFAIEHAAETLPDVAGVVERRWTAAGGRAARATNPMSVDAKTAADVIARGLAFGGLSKLSPETHARTLMRLAFDASAQADLYRSMILGKALPEEIDPRIPLPKAPRGASFEDFLGRLPSLELSKALQGFFAAAGALGNPRPLAGSRIGGVSPSPCCPGDVVTITGEGFGERRRDDVGVFFGSVRANVVKINDVEQWGEARVEVVVPQGVTGEVCVGILEDSLVDANAVANAQQAGAALDGVIGQFFPALGATLPGGLYGSAGLFAGLPQAVCGKTNEVWVGPPQIDFFMANGVEASPASIRFRDGLALSWRVRGATNVTLSFRTLDVTAAAFAPPPPAGALPSEGRIALPLRRVSRGWRAEYALNASNKCGAATPRNMQVDQTFGIGFVFAGTGTASIFNLGALGYIEGRPDLHPMVAAGAGLGSLAAVAAARRPINTTALALFHDEIATLARTGPGLWTPIPGIVQAANAYKSGAHADLLNAVYAFANDVMQRYYAAPQVDSGDVKFDSDATIREKQFGKTLGKVLPYAIKFLTKLADPKPTDTQLLAMDKAELIKVIKAEKLELEPIASALQQSVLDMSGSSDAELSAAKTGAAMLVAIVSVMPGGQIAGAALGMIAAIVFGIVDGVNDAAKRDAMIAALASRGLVNPTPLFTAIDNFMTAINASGTSGPALRVILAQLENGLGAYLDERRRIRDARGETVAVPSAAMPMNVLLRAAVAMPGLIAPLAIPTRILTAADMTGAPVHFVDGSVIDPAPVEEAIEAGADGVFVVQAFPRRLPDGGDYGVPGFYSIMQRSRAMREQAVAKTALDAFEDWRDPDTGLADAVGAYAGSIHVIGASIPMPAIGPFDFESALMALWRDYGFMRAFDVFAPLILHPDPARHEVRIAYEMRLRELTDDIVALRLRAWKLEHEINAERIPGKRWPMPRGDRIVSVTDMALGIPLRALKTAIRDKIAERLTLVRERHDATNWPGVAVPANFRDWFNAFERPIDEVSWAFGIRNPASGVAPPLGPWSDLGDPSVADPRQFLASAPPPPDIPADLLTPRP
jgi:hypothetical protein